MRLERDGNGIILDVGAHALLLTGPARHTPAEIAERLTDEAVAAVARRLPHRLRMAVLVDAGVRAIRSDEEVPAVPFTTVLERTSRP